MRDTLDRECARCGDPWGMHGEGIAVMQAFTEGAFEGELPVCGAKKRDPLGRIVGDCNCTGYLDPGAVADPRD